MAPVCQGRGLPRTPWGAEVAAGGATRHAGQHHKGSRGGSQPSSDAREFTEPRVRLGEPSQQEAMEETRPWGFLMKNGGHHRCPDLGRK